LPRTASGAKISDVIFLRIGWMDHYRGLTSDHIKGGGAFVAQHGHGHEIFNFLAFEGRVFGYVQPAGGAHNADPNGPSGESNKIAHPLPRRAHAML
jgi:hypothetical protein